jgi:lipopolysaccharide assembly protein A
MKYLRYLMLALVALVLVTLALANRVAVPVRLLPDDLAALTGLAGSVDVPVWLVLFAGLLIGLVLGFVWEWLRERQHRKAASSGRKAVARLERELAVMKDSTGLPEDDVLALIQTPKGR